MSSQDSPTDLIGVGESMLMVTPAPGTRLSTASPVALRAGGAESNVAMYVAALGHRAAWCSRLGDDRLGQLVADHVTTSKVDVSLVHYDPDRPTGVYFKDPHGGRTDVYYYRRGSAASALGPAVIDEIRDANPRVLHLSGITPALSESCAELTRLLIEDRLVTSATVCFDVNYRPSLWAQPAGDELLRYARAADVVFVGMDEARALWNVTTADDVHRLIPEPVALVVKDGGVDATSYVREGRYRAEALSVEVVEPVGAGDAFAAGWIVGMLRDLDPLQRLRLGHIVAGSALRSASDHGDLPSDRHISEALGISLHAWETSASRQGA